MLSFIGYPKDMIDYSFWVMENEWQKMPGAVPHMGKAFGFERFNKSGAEPNGKDGSNGKDVFINATKRARPFRHEAFHAESLTPYKNRVRFESLRRLLDPSNTFYASQ